VFSERELRARALEDIGIPRDAIPRIESVDLLGPAHLLDRLAEAQGYSPASLDYVVSSHNFEHLPDPVRFLRVCGRMLKPGGVISMAIPDKRFTFDWFRTPSRVQELLEAFHDARERPTPGQVFNSVVAFRELPDGTRSTDLRGVDPLTVSTHNDLQARYAGWLKRIDENDETYVDAHCWIFTPTSCELVLHELKFLGLIDFDISVIAYENIFEFYVHLRKSANEQPIDAAAMHERRLELMRKTRIEESDCSEAATAAQQRAELEQIKTELARTRATGEATAAQQEAELEQIRMELARTRATGEAVLRSTSWKLTAPLRYLASSLKR
jgi:SAM-dependent methyltransferase